MRTMLLTAVYYLVVTPWGWCRRRVRDPLARRWRPRAETYWHFVPGSGAGTGSGAETGTAGRR
ncbi:hypothetical protein ABZY03_24020 [Streptomyces klenkii]|uniref:hypothetical protein n=1 Tax=Streptomyces klenkii TaxID=1420899 RepID=UPI0033A3961A